MAVGMLMFVGLLSSCVGAESGGVCPDCTVPTVTTSLPANGATNVSVNTSIVVQFSQAVTNVNSTTVTLHSGSVDGALVTATITPGASNTYTLTPNTALSYSTEYFVVVGPGITSTTGVAMVQTTSNFTTAAAAAAPTVTMITPTNGATGVESTTSITLQFSEAVSGVGSADITLHSSNASGSVVTIGTITAGASNTYSFTPTSPLDYSTEYFVVVGSGVTGTATGIAVANTSFSFTTTTAPIQQKAVINISAPGQYPAGTASVTAYVTVTNSSNVNASGLTFTTTNNNTGTTLTLTDSGGSANECNAVNANSTCTLPIVVGANSNAGGFTVVLQGASSSSSFVQKLARKIFASAKAETSGEFTTSNDTADIGLTSVTNNTDGVTGVTLLCPASVPAANSTADTPVGIVANAGANVENFNQMYLTDANGTSLSFQQAPGTSLTGGAGSNLTFMLTIPAGASSPYNAYVRLKKTDDTFAQSTVPCSIRLTHDVVPVLVSYPSSMALDSMEASLLMFGLPIMYSNVGSVPITNLVLTPTSPIEAGTLPPMPTPSPGVPTPPDVCVNGSTLAVGASCMFVAATSGGGMPGPQASFNAGVTATYTGGQLVTPISVSGSSGLLVGTNGFPPFQFIISVGGTQSTQIVLTNTDTVSDATAISFTLPSGFSLSNGLPAGSTTSCVLTDSTHISDLSASGSCTLTLTYTSSSVQLPTTDNMTINYNSSSNVSVPLTYSAQAQ